jgi:hypothetical protein
MSKRDPARFAEINREKARQLILEARAAREMSRSSGPREAASANAEAQPTPRR